MSTRHVIDNRFTVKKRNHHKTNADTVHTTPRSSTDMGDMTRGVCTPTVCTPFESIRRTRGHRRTYPITAVYAARGENETCVSTVELPVVRRSGVVGETDGWNTYRERVCAGMGRRPTCRPLFVEMGFGEFKSSNTCTVRIRSGYRFVSDRVVTHAF